MGSIFPVHADGTIPDVLYKYRPWNDDTKKSLISGDLWFSSPNGFNDPFEFRFVPTIPETDHELQLLCERASEVGFPNETQSERSRRVRELKEEALGYNGVSPLNDDIMRRDFSLCCMSEIQDNLLMWSHYADSHRGVCIGVSTRGISRLCSLAKVEYQDELKKIPCLSLLCDEDKSELIKVARTKSTHWSYEREWRLVRVLKDPGLMKLPDVAIVSVTIGCCASKSTVNDVLEVLAKIGGNLNLNLAWRNRDSYRLDIVPVQL